MKVKTNAKLVASDMKDFMGEEGSQIVYSENYLRVDDGSLVKVNAKDDYKKYEGEEGVATLNIRTRDDGGFKVTLAAFEPEAEPIEF